jgi:hypothetical protein
MDLDQQNKAATNPSEGSNTQQINCQAVSFFNKRPVLAVGSKTKQAVQELNL